MKLGLSLLSTYRGALMGVAIIWVMLHHLTYPDIPILKHVMEIGYGDVDIFLFLSGFGLYFSLSKSVGVIYLPNIAKYYKKGFAGYCQSIGFSC